jgi:deoxyribodipyrimidine photo-lyase
MSSKIGIFIFRRDHRIIDNHGLHALSAIVSKVIPVFILDDVQITRNKHNQEYFSNNAVQFMCESLVDLDMQITKHSNSGLHLYYGIPSVILDQLLEDLKQTYTSISVGWNTDYSNYSVARDTAMKNACIKHGALFVECNTDYTLHPMEDNLSGSGTGYKQFGAYYKRASRNPPTLPITKHTVEYCKYANSKLIQYNIANLGHFYTYNPKIAQHGGRSLALTALAKAKSSVVPLYDTMRNRLSFSTTNISAAINFGCVSVREVYYTLARLGDDSLTKQLYWRDFYLQVVRYIPRATSYTHFIDSRYDNIAWSKASNANTKVEWNILMRACTGFLMVDAAMNQMKTSGFVHGRGRMILAVFWTKYLLISILDPKYGSQVGFSKWLVDAIGPSQNKLNHHWVCDLDYPGKKFSAPGAPLSGRPMDISNKMISKWDPEGTYIKQWLPHLAHIPVKDLRKWDADIAARYDNVHPSPMFDAKTRYAEWVTLCRNATQTE